MVSGPRRFFSKKNGLIVLEQFFEGWGQGDVSLGRKLEGFWKVLGPPKPPKGGAREARAPFGCFFGTKSNQKVTKRSEKSL